MLFLSFTALSSRASAQEAKTAEEEDQQVTEKIEATPLGEPAESAPASKEEDRDAKQDEEIAALKKSRDELQQALEAEREERLDQESEVQVENMEEEQNRLKIFGFVDVQWYMYLFPDDATQKNSKLDNNSFAVGHWNLYLDKKLGDSFRTMGEVRFAFQPYGEQISSGADQSDFERANTEAIDWVDAYYWDWGGISIQRVWIEYKPNDYFGIRAGHYLTPFGVWNVDHGPTVVIPAHRPFIITSQLMPDAQTGLYAYGRLFPSDSTFIDYGLTVSNGRGPVQKLYDLDDHKALGLNLGFSYRGPVSLSFGTYLFWGKTTDTAEVQSIDLVINAVDISDEVVYQYYEKTMSFYLKFEVAGLLLQGE